MAYEALAILGGTALVAGAGVGIAYMVTRDSKVDPAPAAAPKKALPTRSLFDAAFAPLGISPVNPQPGQPKPSNQAAVWAQFASSALDAAGAGFKYLQSNREASYTDPVAVQNRDVASRDIGTVHAVQSINTEDNWFYDSPQPQYATEAEAEAQEVYE